MENNYFAVICWTVEDIQVLKPDWSEEECTTWWKKHEKAFSDILTEYGNECLKIMVNQ